MKLNRLNLFAAVLFALAATAPLMSAAEIEDVMKSAMKGENSLYKKVATAKGDQADADKLLAMLKGLQGTKAPKGDQAAYDKKVTTLVKAAEDVAAKHPGALLKLQTAGNCKACHTAHRED